ncbi:hypothetical protein GCM10018966_089680 [Streptomyces yanii]
MSRAGARAFDGVRELLGNRNGKTAGGGGTGRRVLVQVFVLALVTAVGLVLGGPGAGSADAASSCGGRLAKTVTFSTGEVRIFRSRSYACAITVAKKPGPRRKMSVMIQVRGGRPVADSGMFTKQTGRVTVHALHRCVRAAGSVAGKSGATGWILC